MTSCFMRVPFPVENKIYDSSGGNILEFRVFSNKKTIFFLKRAIKPSFRRFMDNAALRHAEESMEKPLPQKLSLLYSPGGLRGAVRQLFLSPCTGKSDPEAAFFSLCGFGDLSSVGHWSTLERLPEGDSLSVIRIVFRNFRSVPSCSRGSRGAVPSASRKRPFPDRQSGATPRHPAESAGG